MSEADDEVEFGLVMPFVVCQSKGGPYEDHAYVAGWEAAKLDTALASLATLALHFGTSVTFGLPFHANNQPQIDLIAMQHGFVATFKTVGDGWVSLTLGES